MAIVPQNSDAFLREVDDELRRSRMAGFWRRWGIAVAVAAVLVLAVAGGLLWWRHNRTVQAGVDSERMVAALDAVERGDLPAAAPALDALAKSPRDGISGAARLTAADVAFSRGDRAAALAAYVAIAGDADLPAPFRDAALIRQTLIDFDTVPPATVIARLKPLAVAGKPWFGSAAELTGMAHVKAGQLAQAGPIFAAIAADAQVPDSLRRRAVQMAGALGVDASMGEEEQ